MSEKHQQACDVCEKEQPLGRDGYYHIAPSGNRAGRVETDVCSYECIVTWARDNIRRCAARERKWKREMEAVS